MAYVYDAQEKGYRLVCEGCSHQSPMVSLEEKAVKGIEAWYCTAAACERARLARDRELLKQSLIERGMSPTQAETEVAKLRWDLMPDGERVD